MRYRFLSLFALAAVGLLTLSLIRGQDEPMPGQPAESARPATHPPIRDLTHLTDLQKQMLGVAQRGADWLYRMNDVKGRFEHGIVPSLAVPLEGDHFLRQAGAAFALAHTARFSGDDRYTARAAQAILVLLDETVVDKDDPQVRYTSLPSGVINRLGAAGLLVLAIHELPTPQTDLLDKAEQLCNYIRRQARPNGSLACSEAGDDGQTPPDDPELVAHYPGVALYALVHSNKLRPAPWKLEIARKAVVYYRGWWKDHKDPAFVQSQTAVCTELYFLTKDSNCATFVMEMSDYLCGLQYDQIDPRHQQWYGGFASRADGRTGDTVPTVESAGYAEALADGCRVARELGDVNRHERYTAGFERCFQFLVTLQYTDGNTKQFAPWFRDKLVGGFHASHQDGNLRIDYNQHVVSALFQYLEYVTTREAAK